MMFVNIMLAVCVGSYCSLSESGRLCTVGFLVVCESSSSLLQSIAVPYVDCGDDGYVVRL